MQDVRPLQRFAALTESSSLPVPLTAEGAYTVPLKCLPVLKTSCTVTDLIPQKSCQVRAVLRLSQCGHCAAMAL